MTLIVAVIGGVFRSWLATMAIAVSLVVAGCGGMTKPADKSDVPVKKSLAVGSSIANGATLKAPVKWLATLSANPKDPVSQVNFLIDGKDSWTEFNEPYYFNDDGNSLYPWLLGAGTHTLDITATTASGKTSTTRSTITVPVVPTVPAALVGTYERSVSTADLKRASKTQSAPTGKWTLHVKLTGLILFDDPMGSGGTEVLTVQRDRLTLEGPANWLVPENRRGGFCETEPATDYQWTADGAKLTLTGDDRSCPDRWGIFQGIWKRTSN